MHVDINLTQHNTAVFVIASRNHFKLHLFNLLTYIGCRYFATWSNNSYVNNFLQITSCFFIVPAHMFQPITITGMASADIISDYKC